MQKNTIIDPYLSLENLVEIAKDPAHKIRLSGKAFARVARSRALLADFVKKGRTIYGVNTGMGGFVNWLVPREASEELQMNLINGVATNVGAYFSDMEVRAIILARICSLAKGNSAISAENLKKLIAIFNAGIIPCIPQKGSLGASGDLGPLACIALVGAGLWKARYKGVMMSAKDALGKAGLKPMKLNFKEGLALVNGTSAMVGLASLIIYDMERLLSLYDCVSALTLETLKAERKPFDPRVHALKPHVGQQITARNIFNILKDSKMISEEDAVARSLQKKRTGTLAQYSRHIESAYSLRCTPQILGPIRDSAKYVARIIESELNSSNDNPLVVPEHGDVFHNGHFHGQYVAMAMDQLAISITTLSNLSDRRIDRFMDEHNSNGLPPFLSTNPGLRFGLMGGQFMVTSLAAENRSLCVPLSIQTLPSTGDFQDIVSMGLIAARRAKEIFENVKYIIAFEMICACQAADFRGVHLLSSKTRHLYEAVRSSVPFYEKDRYMTEDLEKLHTLIFEMI